MKEYQSSIVYISRFCSLALIYIVSIACSFNTQPKDGKFQEYIVTNDSGDNQVEKRSEVTEQSVSSEVDKFQLCLGNAIINDKQEQEHVIRSALPTFRCYDEIGTWLLRQSCIPKVYSDYSYNAVKPLVFSIRFEVLLNNRKSGIAEIRFFDNTTLSICKTICTLTPPSSCRKRYSYKSHLIRR